MLNENLLHKANRLVNEKSPYLLQHAYNPVDWFPWGEEAFAKAKAEDKPIFLSIGYSTCHWCHVMERECFEDEEVAQALNDEFIAIKVDREERPDIDHIYMEVCQTLTGQGGWPLTIFMTPEKKPFYAGTYFPKKNRMGMTGLISLMSGISDYWHNKRDELLESSEKILDAVRQGQKREAGFIADEELLHAAFKQYRESFDSVYGGFRKAPKFPSPQNIMFLLRYWRLTNNETALAMVRKTLDSMYRGGIYDHIGFGFCRYSTDDKWLVPHFEKMLYDNALLAIVYLEAYQATKSVEYRVVAEDIFRYVLTTMRLPGGGFYSAEDADSEGVEGKYYVFSREEVLDVLGDEAGEKYSDYYDITEGGNFEKKNILNLINSTIPEEDKGFIENCRQKLFDYREKRVHPHKDDKTLTGWNSMMITALAIGGRTLDNPGYIEAAEQAIDFISLKLTRSDGRILARFRDGEAAYPAYAEDYAYLIWALVELYETTLKTKHLKQALFLLDEMFKYFWDEGQGGFYLYGSDSESLLLRPKEIYDGAVPSSNSVMIYNLIRLARITGNEKYEERAVNILNFFGKELQKYPTAYAFALVGLTSLKAKTTEIVIADGSNETNANKALKAIGQSFSPFISILYINQEKSEIEALIPSAKNYRAINEKTTMYICRDHACMEPTNDLEAINRFIM